MKLHKFPNLVALLVVLTTVAGCEESVEVQARIGETTPPFTLELTTGEALTVDGLPGNARAITFMETWASISRPMITGDKALDSTIKAVARARIPPR